MARSQASDQAIFQPYMILWVSVQKQDDDIGLWKRNPQANEN